MTLKQDGIPIPNGNSSLIDGTNQEANSVSDIWKRTENTAYRFWGEVHLKTLGSPNPEEEQRRIYKSLESSKEEFDNEVKTFTYDFGRLMASRDYIQLAEDLAGLNSETFGLMKSVLLKEPQQLNTMKTYSNRLRIFNIAGYIHGTRRNIIKLRTNKL
ncbi:unnamed protein product [Didymodactylos carnosus]|uniref:Uncharacterized protein n=1 Tax=Didymodactylos carnosus TaxID=1234261 RepID=A0A815E361_9BILA|nr:unnamed protein product [Didymodactylos carnosus]CAF1301494.1 unnamed protein product [Didymodactylos carnosus]CAF3875092.1 unnamed protein product [Didymodactylos carnosus]CAF4126471.1 unnamed protein product [Didymodactylos carnosus]